jgi:hypothetical protein
MARAPIFKKTMEDYLLFNDAEEGFPAQCTLLFGQRAQNYLDMESLAILGGTLAHRLSRS